MKKKGISLLLAVVLLVGLLPLRTVEASTLPNKVSYISTNVSITGTTAVDEYGYQFNLPNDGYISLDYTRPSNEAVENGSWTLEFWNSRLDLLVRYTFSSGGPLQNSTGPIGLAGGTYYLIVRGTATVEDVPYTFMVHYTEAGGWEKELNDEAPNYMSMDEPIKGSIMSASDADLFEISLPDGGYRIAMGHAFEGSSDAVWQVELTGGGVMRQFSFHGNTEGVEESGMFGLRGGTYQLRVTGGSYYKGSEYQLTVEYLGPDYENEVNDEKSLANDLDALGGHVYGTRDDFDGRDWYSFWAGEGEGVCISANAPTVLVGSGWEHSFEGTSPEIGLREGRYYLRVTPAGDYEVQLQRLGRDWETENNNSFSAASTLHVGQELRGSSMTGSDIDYYEFTWDEDEGALIRLGHEIKEFSTASWTVTVYYGTTAIASQVFAEKDAPCDMLGGLGLRPGERYYISVQGSTTETYTLSVNGDGRKWEHESNNNKDEATRMDLQGSRLGQLSTSGDVDYFLLPVEAPGALYLSFYHPNLGMEATQSAYWQVQLLDASGKELAWKNYAGNNDGSDWGPIGLRPGDYYVKIRNTNSNYFSNGVYTLSAVLDPRDDWEEEDNDDYLPARKLPVDTSVTGTIMRSGEPDYYELEMPVNGGIFPVFSHDQRTGSNAQWTVTLQNDQHETLDSWTYRAAEESFRTAEGMGLSYGTYYLIVNGSGNAADLEELTYTLAAELDDSPWEVEFNENRASASELEINTLTRGNLRDASDVDYFWLSLPYSGVLQLTFEHPDLGVDATQTSYWSVTLLNEAGTELAWESYAGKGDGSTWGPIGLSAGVYYVRVKNTNSNYYSGGVYNLIAEFAEDPFWEEEVNDSYDEARAVNVDEEIHGAIIRSGEPDYYRFYLAESGGICLNFDHEQAVGSDVQWTVTLQNDQHETLDSWTYRAADESFDMEDCVGLDAGTYYVIVNGSGSWKSLTRLPYSLTPALDTSTLWEREWNDLRLTATGLPFDEIIRGNLMTSDDVDYYRINVEDPGYFRLQFTHPDLGVDATQTSYWSVTLIDASGKEMAWKSYAGKGEGSTWSEIGLAPGAYYVRVKNNNSNYYSSRVYSLLLEWNDTIPWEQEWNNDYYTATPIEVNRIVGGTLMTASDADYYSFTLDRDGGVFLQMDYGQVADSGCGWTAEILDEEHNVIVSRRFNQSSKPVFNDTDGFGLPAGDYFLRITAGGSWSDRAYNVQVDLNSRTVWEQEGNNSRDAATAIPVNEDVYGSLMTSDDVDYYKLELKKDSGVTLTFTHPDLGVDATQTSYWSVTLIDASGAEMAWESYAGKGTGSVWSGIGLAAGTYYVRVKNNNSNYYNKGIYTLRADADTSAVWEREWNNGFGTASAIPLNGPVHGGLMNSSDADYYQVQVTDNGYVTLRFDHEQINSSNIYWVFTLYDDEFNQMTSGRCAGNSPDGLTTAGIGLLPGTYYVSVVSSSYSKVNYTLEVMFSNSGLWEKEKNNSFGTANSLPLGKTIHGGLMTSDDKDYYAFDLTQPGYVDVYFAHLKLSDKNNYWRLTLYNAERNVLVSYDCDGMTTARTSDGLGLPVGRYYLLVQNPNSNYYSDFVYDLAVTYHAAGDWETEFNDSRETANTIGTNLPVHGSLMNSSDTDYYLFDLPSDDSVALTFLHGYVDTSSAVWSVTLMDASGNSKLTMTSAGYTTSTQTSAVKELNAGTYYVSVSRSTHSSLPYTLTVRTYGASLARIDTQPQNASGTYGQTVRFTVGASGAGLRYQWQYSANQGQTWRPTGGNSAELSRVVNTANDGWLFRCSVTDSWGNTVTSDAAALTLNRAPLAITAQPADVLGDRDEMALFQIAATGDLLRYQWEYSTNDGQTWRSVGGDVTEIQCRISAATDGRLYRCTVTDIYENSLVSNTARLQMNRPALEILCQPQDYTGVPGDTAVFTVEAEGEDLIYQWEYSPDGGAVWKTTGSSVPTLRRAITQSMNGWLFRCTVTDGYNQSLTSDTARLTVTSSDGPVITGQPADVTAAQGDPVSFHVEATGAGLTYQWQYQRPEDSRWYDSEQDGSRTDTLTLVAEAALNGASFRCVVTDEDGNTVISNAATLTVQMLPAPTITSGTTTAAGKPTLKWSAVEGADKYVVYRAASKDGVYSKFYNTANTSFTNTGAEVSKTYWYKICALDAEGREGSFSEPIGIRCRPAAPTVTGTTSTAGKPTLTWNAVDGAARYIVYRSESKDSGFTKYYTTADATKTSFTNTSAEAGKTYYYKVYAADSANYWSAASTAVGIRTRLPAPTITSSGTTAAGKPTFKWAAIEGAVSYVIYRADSKDGTYSKYHTTTAASFTNTSAEVGKTYYYKVYAVDSANYWSAASTAVSIRCRLPAPTITSSGVNASGKPVIGWDAVEGAASYIVYRAVGEGSSFTKYYTTDKTSFTNTSAEAGKTYYYKVYAADSANYWSAASDPVSVTPTK